MVMKNSLERKDEAASFPIVWEHGVLPFLIEFIPKWCGPHHVISIIRGSTLASRRLYIMTKRQLSRARSLMIAAHVRDLLPSRYLRTTAFTFSTGAINQSIQNRNSRNATPTHRNPFYFAELRMGDSIGIRGTETLDDSSATLGPCLIVGRVGYWLVSLHPFMTPTVHHDQIVEHPSSQDRNRCLFEGHDAMMDIDFKLGNLEVTSGLNHKTTRISQDPYWRRFDQEPPLVLTDWALVRSNACKANITVRFPSEPLHPRKDPLVRATSAVVPGRVVFYAGRTSGHKHGRVCEIPAYVSADANGTEQVTREWFIEESYDEEDFMIRGGDGIGGNSGAAIVDASSNKLVGQIWGHNRCSVPGPPHLEFFTAINDVFDDILKKYGRGARPCLPQHRDGIDKYPVHPSCHQCYELHTHPDSRRSSRILLQSMIMGRGDGGQDLTNLDTATELATPRDYHHFTGTEEAGPGPSISDIRSPYATTLSLSDLEDYAPFRPAKKGSKEPAWARI